MNPETARDRRTFVEDFGEVCTISPVAGGSPFAVTAIFNDGPSRSSDLDVAAYGDMNIVGSNPHLEMSKEDRAKVSLLDVIEIPSRRPLTYRIQTIEPEDIDGGFFTIELLEA